LLYLHLWSDVGGDSHITEMEPDFESRADYARGVPPVAVSRALDAGVVHFLRLPAGWVGDSHPAPARQFVIQAQGRLQVTATDGTTLTTGPATVWLVEDTTGKGHRTAVVGAEDSISLVVTLAG
jgi:hypothetical protein